MRKVGVLDIDTESSRAPPLSLVIGQKVKVPIQPLPYRQTLNGVVDPCETHKGEGKHDLQPKQISTPKIE